MATNVGVPGVPTGALDAITDENTRVVLQSIIDGWNVRNGTTGNGDSRFITAGELSDQVNKVVISGLPSNLGAGGTNSLGGLIQHISTTLSSMQASVLASELWAKLGERIQLVDIPALQTGITNEANTRVSSDNALVDAVNKIWATVGSNTALVTGGSTVAATGLAAIATNWNQVQATIKDPVTGVYVGTAAVRDNAKAETDLVRNRLTAERTIKVDVNGYVAGFGIIANYDMTTGATSSDFGVRADRFFIGSPSTGNAVPFIATTTNTVLNGVTVPPGVYMTDAMIQNGAIGTAKIGTAAVETLKIKGEAVTVPRVYSNDTSQLIWNGSRATLISATGNAEGGSAIIIGVVGVQIPGDHYGQVELYIGYNGGTESLVHVLPVGVRSSNGEALGFIPAVVVYATPPGTTDYSVTFKGYSGDDQPGYYIYKRLILMSGKR